MCSEHIGRVVSVAAARAGRVRLLGVEIAGQQAAGGGYSQPRRRKTVSIETSTPNITTMITQNAWIEFLPGRPVFIPQIEAISVSGRITTEIEVSTRSTLLSRCEISDSFVSSRASTTSL